MSKEIVATPITVVQLPHAPKRLGFRKSIRVEMLALEEGGLVSVCGNRRKKESLWNSCGIVDDDTNNDDPNISVFSSASREKKKRRIN